MSDIHEKLDKIIEQQVEMNVTLVKQQLILDEHVKRSNLLEDGQKKLREEMKPIEKHVMIVNFLFKAVITLITLATPILGILKALGKI